jgi:hypothetical protein
MMMPVPTPITNGAAPTEHLAPEAFTTLLGIVRDALAITPPLFLSSVLGLPWTWALPRNRYSELGLIDPWRLGRTVQFLSDALVPALPIAPPPIGSAVMGRAFWRPTVILQRPDQYGSSTSHLDEAWFFLNGILTNDAVAQLNAAYLAYLFHRPITLIQNSTCGLAADLLECAFGKASYRTTDSVTQAFPAIYDALKSERRRVVLIAHSQGTIITAIVLRLLYALTRRPAAAQPGILGESLYAGPEFVYPDDAPLVLEDFAPLELHELSKLEVYCFANCATTMPYYQPPSAGQPAVPWVESFGNEYDIVARLGMQAPRPAEWRITIAGPRYVRPGAWGHLLNEHYLRPIELGQKVGRRRGGRGGTTPFTRILGADTGVTPRLYAYLNGGAPPASAAVRRSAHAA